MCSLETGWRTWRLDWPSRRRQRGDEAMPQRPTCTGIRVRSVHDAHIIFHAVSLKILPMITRRLDADERANLRSGCVYAWEERGPHTEVTGLGIERFTEGTDTRRFFSPWARFSLMIFVLYLTGLP